MKYIDSLKQLYYQKPCFIFNLFSTLILIIIVVFICSQTIYDSIKIYSVITCQQEKCFFSVDMPLNSKSQSYEKLTISRENYLIVEQTYSEPYLNYQLNIPYQKITINFNQDTYQVQENQIEEITLHTNPQKIYQKLLNIIFRKENYEQIR